MQHSSRAPDWLRAWGPLALALALAVLFRLPLLVNAGAVNSDAAVAGLQAMHLLRGEWAPRLWGAPYQSSADVVLVAGAFALLGPTPLALALVPLAGALLAIALSYDVLLRRVSPWSAFFCVQVLVLAPMAANLSMIFVMRQALATTCAAGVWLLDGASSSRRPLLGYAAGGLACGLAALIDLFSLVLLPALLLFAGLASLDDRSGGRERQVLRRLGAALLGFAIPASLGGVLFLGAAPAGSPSQLGLSPDRIQLNLALLREACLPFALGGRVTQLVHGTPWQPPPAVDLLLDAGALLFAAGLCAGGVAAVFRRLPWPVRRLGLLGFTATAVAIAGFLLSLMPRDIWSVRYLAPLVWMAPFALAPAAYVAGRWLAAAAVPLAAALLVGGWASYGPFVEGPLPALHPLGAAADERQVCQALRQRGVRHAAAGYWTAYRLTFLCGEDPVVIPLGPGDDRYPPYRRAFEAAPVVGLVHQPSEPFAPPPGLPVERVEVGAFTVFMVRR